MEEIIRILQRAFANMAITTEDLFNIVFSLLVAVIIAIVVSQLYKLTHRGVNYEQTFMTSLVMLAPIVTIVMFFIQGNLVLSLGLVGSLSIIRFRTPIKDTRDMVYLFWVIAVGLGAGTYHWALVTVSSLVILIFSIILFYLKYGRSKNHDYILVLNGKSNMQRDEIRSVINQFAIDAKIRSQSIDEDLWEMVYEVNLKDSGQPVDEFIEKLHALETITNISLLAPTLALPA